MTFKPLDLQMSVPRTQEFGSIQQQAAQRPLSEQNILANQASKHTDELRKQNAAIEQSSKPHVRADQDGSQGNSQQRNSKNRDANGNEENGTSEPSVHPYKGHRFDIKL